jgi:glycosyltransferase involved in cell wall biosynthesis
MKINFLLPCYAWGPSGGFKVVYEYANRLVARGHQVSVIHPRRLKFPPPEHLTIRKRMRIARLWLTEIRSKPAIHWHTIDPRVRLLYVPTSDSRYVPDGDILFATAWHTVRSVMECPEQKGHKWYLIQGYETWQGPQNLVNETWLAPLRKIAVSKWLVNLGKELGCDDITHIPNGVDGQRYRVVTPIQQRVRQVVMTVSQVPIKASQDGIKALEIAREKFPDMRAVVFGKDRFPPAMPSWITYVQDPSQEFLVEQILNNSSIVLSPSLTEGFGLPLAEGAACGCAMVATDSGGVRDFIIHGKTGLLSAPRDPKALAENLCMLLANDALRIRLAEEGRSVVVGFTWERSANLLESLLSRAVQRQAINPASLPHTSSSQLQVPHLEMN